MRTVSFVLSVEDNYKKLIILYIKNTCSFIFEQAGISFLNINLINCFIIIKDFRVLRLRFLCFV